MRCGNCIQRHKVQKETWINFASRCWAEKTQTQTFLMRTKSFSHSVRLLISSSYLRGRKTKKQVIVRWWIFNSVMSGNRLSLFPKGTVGGASGPSLTPGYHRICVRPEQSVSPSDALFMSACQKSNGNVVFAFVGRHVDACQRPCMCPCVQSFADREQFFTSSHVKWEHALSKPLEFA